jgi:hypothetical protein
MELKVNELVVPEKIKWNYGELKKELTEKTELYATVVYTDETIKQAKADRAKLNALKTALNSERIRMEREYMTPFNEFKSQVAEIIGIIDKPVKAIDAQIKDYEKREQDEKRAKIIELFDGIENKPEWLKIEQLWDPRWLNKSTTFRMIEENILGWLNRIETELATIETLAEGSFEAEAEYKRTLDMGGAIAEGQKQARIQREKAEAEKAKAPEMPEPLKEESPLPWDDVKEGKPEDVFTATVDDGRIWVHFAARLNVDEALALNRFMRENGIEFKAEEEG